MHQLLLTLGRGHRAEGQRYRNATYRFPDGVCSKETPFFGVELLRWLQRQEEGVNNVVVIGTAASMWDAWLEVPQVEAAARDEEMKLYGTLHRLTENNEVTESVLEPLRVAVEQHLEVTVRFCIIPVAVSPEDQALVLERVAAVVEPEAHLSIDLTHGLRHLPILQLLSVFHLQLTKGCHVAGAYYGALELAGQYGGTAPVVRLDFALELFGWLRAIVLAERAADYTGIVGLLAPGSPLAGHLAKSTFLVRSAQVAEARLSTGSALKEVGALRGAGTLFAPRLRYLLDWSHESSLAKRQLALGCRFFDSGDYLRAAVLAMEAFVTVHVRNGDPLNFDHRRTARGEALDRVRRSNGFTAPWNAAYEAFRGVDALRNSLAHGTRALGSMQPVIRPMLADEQRMKQNLRSWLELIQRALESGAPPL
jgi:CRISPR-associated Csx2 family protein